MLENIVRFVDFFILQFGDEGICVPLVLIN